MNRYFTAPIPQTISNAVLAVLMILCPSSLFSQDWNNCGGNSLRNGLSPTSGPDAPVILWQGSEFSLFGNPVFIEEDFVVTMRFISFTYAPVVCHDLNTGDLLWTVDVTSATGRSVPIGIKDGKVYVMRYLESLNGDSLYALDVLTGDKIWTAEALVRPSLTESCVFASNGDLLVEGNLSLLRIDATNGSTVWETIIYPWVVGWLCPTIFENTVYVEQNSLESLAALDINTGAFKYAHAIDPLGGNGQTPFMIGSDGVIYVQSNSTGALVTALKDDGDSLSVLWTTPIDGYSVFCNMAESPDSTIYVPANYKVYRLLKSNGAIIDSTDVLGSFYAYIARVSVGQDGKVYIATENTFLCTEPDLTPIFTETIPNLNTSGCAIGTNHSLAIAGSGTDLRVYRSSFPENTQDIGSETSDLFVYPNPVPDRLFIHAEDNIVDVKCYNQLGQSMKIFLEFNSIDVSRLPAGLYTLEITTRESSKVLTFIKK